MKLTEYFLAELDRQAASTRSALARVPEGNNDWKPHPKSMALGSLASLVASMPAWIVSMIRNDEFDMKSPEAEKFKPVEWRTRNELIGALDQAVSEARVALQQTSDEHLSRPWRFVAGGHVLSESPRHSAISEEVFIHLAHHRGQLTVYLRLNETRADQGSCD